MNKKFILLPALAAAVLGITSCSTNKNKDTVDPSKPQGTEMTADEIKAFAKKGFEEYYFEHLEPQKLFKTVRSGKVEAKSYIETVMGGQTSVENYTGNAEFALDNNYVYGKVGGTKTLTSEEKSKTINTSLEIYYETANEVTKEYKNRDGDKTFEDCLSTKTYEDHIFFTLESITNSGSTAPFVFFDMFEDMLTKDTIKMYKEKDAYFADYTYVLDGEITYKNKIRYNKDYLPIYAQISASRESPEGEKNPYSAKQTATFSITPCEVTKKDFDKTGYTPVQYN